MIHSRLPSPRIGLISMLVLLAPACSSTPPANSARDRSTGPSIAKTREAPSPATRTTVAIDDAILRACHISNDQAYFAFDSANLKSSAVHPLEAVADCFTHGPLKGRSLKLVGRADPRGDEEYNFVLGQSRADSVGSVLKRDGLARSRITATSRGDMDAKGRNESGWSLDRRVDVVLGS